MQILGKSIEEYDRMQTIDAKKQHWWKKLWHVKNRKVMPLYGYRLKQQEIAKELFDRSNYIQDASRHFDQENFEFVLGQCCTAALDSSAVIEDELRSNPA